MHALVVGANGLVGSRLVATLVKQGHRVSAIGRGPRRLTTTAEYHSVDLADAATLQATITAAQPELILNTAAMTDVDGCEREPEKAFAANVDGVATLARTAKSLGAHLVHVSTDYVFDGETGGYTPDSVPNPRGVYAITKHMGEQAVRALCAPTGWTIARTAVVFGYPPAGQKNFGSWLVDALSKRTPVKLFDDQWVNPSMALNVAEMVAELGTRALGGIWHTCGAEVVDRVTFGKRLCAAFDFDPSLITPSKMADVKLLSPRPAKSGLDVRKTQELLNAKPWSLDEALRRFVTEVNGVTS
jgi:dTDP-4-dehydrorhamnose reductase